MIRYRQRGLPDYWATGGRVILTVPRPLARWDPQDPHTGPNIFLDRLRTAGFHNERVYVCNGTLGATTYGRLQSGKYLVARLGGVARHLFSGKNLYGLVKQRRPGLLPLLSAVRSLPTFPPFVSRLFNRVLSRRWGRLWLLKNADAIVFQSRLSRDLHRIFLGYRSGRVPETVILNGVSLDKFRPRPVTRLEGFPALIISAALHRLGKRLPEAVRLVNHLADSFPRVRLHIVGGLDGLVSEAISALDTSRCVFHDRQPPEVLPDLYAGADVQLSLAIFDPCPNVVCEGLASGLPVLTPLESGAAELIGATNAHWTVAEGLPWREYLPLHVASRLPRIPLANYSLALTRVIDQLPAERARARARAEDALDIRKVAKQYAAFVAEAFPEAAEPMARGSR
jgi:glycosyltransferase involved in cell wall biosynthesis